MSYDPYEALQAYIDKKMYEDALRMVNEFDEEFLKRLRFLDISDAGRYTLMSKRTAAEKLRTILAVKIKNQEIERQREYEQRERERSERIARMKVPGSADNVYHIDPDILAIAEANETEVDFAWMEA